MATHWAIDGTQGADLENTISSANFAAQTDGRNRFKLLQQVAGNNNSKWVFAYASAAIGQYALVGIRQAGTATTCGVTEARLGMQLGIAQTAFAAGDYGWIALQGRSLVVQTTGATAVGVRLYTSGTTGKVTGTAASTQAQIGGLYLVATASGTSASSAACVAGYLQVVDAAFAV